jgi:hypothetical protein
MVFASGLNMCGGTHEMCQTIMRQAQDILICPFVCYILVKVVKKKLGFLVVFNLAIFYHCGSVELFSFLSVNSAFIECCVHKCDVNLFQLLSDFWGDYNYSMLYILTLNVKQNLGSAMRMTSQLMLCREIIAVCSEIHTKHINALRGQNVELLNVKLALHIVATGL